VLETNEGAILGSVPQNFTGNLTQGLCKCVVFWTSRKVEENENMTSTARRVMHNLGIKFASHGIGMLFLAGLNLVSNTAF